jgi:hypothetical protein
MTDAHAAAQLRIGRERLRDIVVLMRVWITGGQ